ncbi:MAG: hypothetical protein ACYC26_17545 [Phycisphaerales bacterium]
MEVTSRDIQAAVAFANELVADSTFVAAAKGGDAILIAGGLISLAIYSRDEPLSSSLPIGPAENTQDEDGDSATR